jgi:prevent-host-death family protein
MATVNIHEAKTNFSKLVDEAASGKEIIIAKAGKPVAKLVSLNDAKRKRKPRRRLGLLKGEMTLRHDFFDPLPDDVLAGFGGGD